MLLIVVSMGMVTAHASDCRVKVFKGSVLHFVDSPFKYKYFGGDDESNGAEYFPDGVLMIDCDGKVMAAGAYKDFANQINQIKNADVVDYTGKLIMPGFIDMHVHLPQETMVASYGASLMPWLNEYVFATEALFHDKKTADLLSKRFITDLLVAGTTTAVIHDTIHKVAVEAAFNAAKDKNMRVIVGKIGMDRCRYGGFFPGNTTPPLCDTADSFYDESKELIEKFLTAEKEEQSRVLYAVTPRFAPSSTEAQLAKAGQLMKEYSNRIYMQTHLSENFDEIALVRAMYGHLTPSGKQDRYQASYLEVYDHFGLVGNRSIFAHALHLSQSDWELMAKKGAVVGHCPSSNLFLGSGLFNFRAANQSGVRFGVGSDVGAGTALNTFVTLNEAYKVSITGSTWLSSEMPDGNFPNGIRIFDSDVLCPEVYESPNSGCCGCDVKETGPTSMPAPENHVRPNDFALNAAQAFYLATLGGAEALSLQDKIGSFKKGNEADFVVIDIRANAMESLRIDYLKETTKWKRIWETLFSVMILGNGDNILSTYLMGNLVHNKPQPSMKNRCCYDGGCTGTDCEMSPASCANDEASCMDCGGDFCSGPGNTGNTTSGRKRFADLFV